MSDRLIRPSKGKPMARASCSPAKGVRGFNHKGRELSKKVWNVFLIDMNEEIRNHLIFHNLEFYLSC